MKDVAKTHAGALRAWETRRLNLKLKRIVRAISIHQPYAEMIMRGTKREEYRSNPTLIKNEFIYTRH